ncbi:MAG: DNA gyrase subunit A [Gemmatimonadetes bacterium]|nr:DNA gyrase subunit A [Gemmatimonadota bacterium]
MATEAGERILPRYIEDEMRESFIDYSMSVIVQRALPDVRDGLKPVHRRILFSMHELGLLPGRPHKKSATVVGEVLGKYHPHGDLSVYDALVRMVQDFSMRYALVDGQGNFGSVDGDPAAAYRYTEVRLTPIAMEMLADIEKETVDSLPNFDGRLREPTVLPANFPNLLCNGSSGIAVGMATNIPPHNLREVVAACLHLIDRPDASVADLMKHVRGPDFPTGAFLYGREGIREAYRNGRGRLVMRARAEIEEREGGRGLQITVSEIPFMVNKSRLIEQIAELVREKKITGISDLRDESDREGMRIVIELTRDAIPQIVLNQLYKHTQMQSTFGVINLALVDGVPRVLNLKELIRHFLDHRHEVVVRRSRHDLQNAQNREHIFKGLKVAVDHIDEVVEIIRRAKDAAQAQARLQKRFQLSERQAQAILDMRLARLTSLAIEELATELKQVRALIKDLKDILAAPARRWAIIRDELRALGAKYGDDRRTEIVDEAAEFSVEDLIAEEEMVITVSHDGYIKRLPVDTYRRQRRGGRGVSGMATKEEDWVEHLFVASTHDHLLFVTARGRLYGLKVHEIPEAGRVARGKPIHTLVGLSQEDRIAAMLHAREFAEDRTVMFVTGNGVVKKTPLAQFANPRRTGIIAIVVGGGDECIDAQVTDGTNEIILATRGGLAIRFPERDVRPMGRAAHGVRGITLRKGDRVVGMVVARRKAEILTVTEKGMGKRTELSAYRRQHRGGRGVINMRLTAKTGKVVGIKEVVPQEEVMLITRKGIVNRQRVSEIRKTGRAAQGVRLIMLEASDLVVDVASVVSEEAEERVGAEAVPAPVK